MIASSLQDYPGVGFDGGGPSPAHTAVIVVPVADGVPPVSVVRRVWFKSDARACGLCPAGACVARRTAMYLSAPGRRRERAYACTMLVEGVVDDASADTVSLPG